MVLFTDCNKYVQCVICREIIYCNKYVQCVIMIYVAIIVIQRYLHNLGSQFFRKIIPHKYVQYTEHFTIVTILVVGMYGTIYGTHRHRTPTPTPTPDTDTDTDDDVLIFLSSRHSFLSFIFFIFCVMNRRKQLNVLLYM